MTYEQRKASNRQRFREEVLPKYIGQTCDWHTVPRTLSLSQQEDIRFCAYRKMKDKMGRSYRWKKPELINFLIDFINIPQERRKTEFNRINQEMREEQIKDYIYELFVEEEVWQRREFLGDFFLGVSVGQCSELMCYVVV